MTGRGRPQDPPTDADVGAFIESVADERRRDEARTGCRLMQEVTGEEPVLRGTVIVGFGSVRAARSVWPRAQLAGRRLLPRKAATTVYLMDGFEEGPPARPAGPHHGEVCLHLKRLADVDLAVLAN